MKALTPSLRKSSAGFSLIEILVSVAVLAVGLLAIAALQGALSRNMADARARSQVGAFVEQVLERQRSLGSGSGFVDIPVANSFTTAELNAVADSAGVSNLAVNVTATHYDGRTGTFTAYTPGVGAAISGSDPQYKEIRVVATWTDATGGARRIEMPAIVSPRAISDSVSLLDMPTNNGTQKSPVVRTTAPTAPGVIPIAIGDNTDTAATNPRPEIAGKNNNQSIVGTNYEILTYHNENQTTVRTQRRVETKVIACSCQRSSDPTGDFSGSAQWPAYWTGERYEVFVPGRDEDGNPQPSYAGPEDPPGETLVAGPVANAVQDELCTDCCRDHHDTYSASEVSNNDLVLFDPFRTDAMDQPTTHQHYKLQGGSLVLAADDDNYVEACRMIRVDGFWRTASDLGMQHLGLIATENTAKSAVPTSAAVAGYESFVLDFLASNYVDGGADTPAETVFASKGLNDPAKIMIGRPSPVDTRFLHARGLYVDHLEARTLDKIDEAVANCPDGTDDSDCVLPLLPFTTINTTELAFWAASDPTIISVTTGSNLVFNPLLPARGRVNGLASAPAGLQNANAIASQTRSNSGVAIAGGVDPGDDIEMTDLQAFELQPGGAAGGAQFKTVLAGLPQVLDNNTSNDPAVAWSVGGNSDNCVAKISTQGNPKDYNPNDYECNTTASLASPGATVRVRVQSYNRQDDSRTASVTCTDAVGTATETREVRWCQNYQVDTATLVGGTLVAGSPVNDGQITGEYTEIDFANVVAASSKTINFTLQGETQQTTKVSCKVKKQGNNYSISELTWANCP